MKPHKHAEVIKAWADGAEIQLLDDNGIWLDFREGDTPAWNPAYKYRVKPQPKPDVVVSRWVYSDGSTSRCSQSNVRYTFDGETHELKSAEVLK